MIAKLKAAGVPVTTVGIQGHGDLTWPSLEQLDATIAAFAKLGVKVAVTELDVDVLPPATAQQTAEISLHVARDPALDPYTNGLPEAVQQKLAQRYAALFGVFLKHPGVFNRVTLWGVTDAGSWKNDWPVFGRTDYPLLFGRDGKPKPAYDAVIKEAGQ